jgi:hypothetical protein
MRTKIPLFVVAAVVGIVVTSRMVFKSVATRELSLASDKLVVIPEMASQPKPPLAVSALAPEPLVTEVVRHHADNAPEPETKRDGNLKVAPEPTKTKKPKEPLRDPEARAAMSLVGIDPEAEAYWLGAIFDSTLPENEREDLMEDLNEEGLSDHKHPGPKDLPLILNRLAIIEEVLPLADAFMVKHLGEAYKDLVNLAAVTQGGGEPVR